MLQFFHDANRIPGAAGCLAGIVFNQDDDRRAPRGLKDGPDQEKHAVLPNEGKENLKTVLESYEDLSAEEKETLAKLLKRLGGSDDRKP